jgi:hypothetical protein
MTPANQRARELADKLQDIADGGMDQYACRVNAKRGIDLITAALLERERAVWWTAIKYLEELCESERNKSPDDRIGDGSIQTLNQVVGWCRAQAVLKP